MTILDEEALDHFIHTRIYDYHNKLLSRLQNLKLNAVLRRKNPYLFRAKSLNTSQDLVKCILDAHLSSQEEGIFGAFLEELSIFVCEKVYNGRKSSAEGIDLEFDKDDIRYIVSIKSGPHWGNSQQIARMRDNFKRATRVLRTNVSEINVRAVNGCCYGRERNYDKGDYLKLCGQRYWELVSGQENFYKKIIKPIGHKAKQRNEEFKEEYAKVINKFSFQFMQDYCDKEGAINWDALLKYNSGKV